MTTTKVLTRNEKIVKVINVVFSVGVGGFVLVFLAKKVIEFAIHYHAFGL